MKQYWLYIIWMLLATGFVLWWIIWWIEDIIKEHQQLLEQLSWLNERLDELKQGNDYIIDALLDKQPK
jgi:hypothetical protein